MTTTQISNKAEQLTAPFSKIGNPPTTGTQADYHNAGRRRLLSGGQLLGTLNQPAQDTHLALFGAVGCDVEVTSGLRRDAEHANGDSADYKPAGRLREDLTANAQLAAAHMLAAHYLNIPFECVVDLDSHTIGQPNKEWHCHSNCTSPRRHPRLGASGVRVTEGTVVVLVRDVVAGAWTFTHTITFSMDGLTAALWTVPDKHEMLVEVQKHADPSVGSVVQRWHIAKSAMAKWDGDGDAPTAVVDLLDFLMGVVAELQTRRGAYDSRVRELAAALLIYGNALISRDGPSAVLGFSGRGGEVAGEPGALYAVHPEDIVRFGGPGFHINAAMYTYLFERDLLVPDPFAYYLIAHNEAAGLPSPGRRERRYWLWHPLDSVTPGKKPGASAKRDFSPGGGSRMIWEQITSGHPSLDRRARNKLTQLLPVGLGK